MIKAMSIADPKADSIPMRIPLPVDPKPLMSKDERSSRHPSLGGGWWYLPARHLMFCCEVHAASEVCCAVGTKEVARVGTLVSGVTWSIGVSGQVVTRPPRSLLRPVEKVRDVSIIAASLSMCVSLSVVVLDTRKRERPRHTGVGGFSRW